MLSQIVALLVTVLAVIGLALRLRLPHEAGPTDRLGYATGVVACAWLIALLSPVPTGLGYKAALVFGLILTLLAVALLESGFLPEYVAHGHLLWAYVTYAYGFATLTVWTWPSPWLVLPIIVAGAVCWLLRTGLRDLWETALIFAALLAAAAFQALNWVLQAPAEAGAWAGLIAVLLIAAAHAIQALARFRGLSPRPAGLAVAVLLAAQLPLAWSVWTWGV